MAQQVFTLLQDDIDGTKAAETISFGLDGTSYQIDLNAKHAAKLRRELEPFISAGRRIGGRSTRSRAAAAAPSPAKPRKGRASTVVTPVDPAAVRAWAAANRIKVSPRGRIAAAVVEQFRAAGH